MYKRWTLFTLIITLVILLGLAAITAFIDPFFVYRKPASEYGYYINNETYQNPGIARHFDYDAVILGSSMAQNFSTLQIDGLFGVKSVKLTYSGAYAIHYKKIMDVVQENKSLKKVFWGIDIHSMMQPADKTRNPLPEYLYDTDPLNDIEYLLNKGVFLRDILYLLNKRANVANTTLDSAYNWYTAHKDKFTSAAVLEHYYSSRGTERPMQPKIAYMDIVTLNMEKNILPVIKKNSSTEFYILLPPYSIFYWDNVKYQGDLEAYLYIEEYIIETLLGYDNVNVYYFQNDEKIIFDISKYKDTTHYHPDINSFMIEAISKGEYRLTKENYKQLLEDMHELVINCDIDTLIKTYTLKAAN